jgi:glycerol-3-phosphate dehydrogenase
MDHDALSPAQRSDALARMASEVFDVVVIGGGVTARGSRWTRRPAG